MRHRQQLKPIKNFGVSMKAIEIIKLVFSIALFGLASLGVFIMGIRTIFNPSRLDVFNNARLPVIAIQIWGLYCMFHALLIIHPRTLIIGCILLLLNNVFVIIINLKVANIEGAIFEAAMISIAIGLILLGHPYTQWTQIHLE
jgi:hypothetical protein